MTLQDASWLFVAKGHNWQLLSSWLAETTSPRRARWAASMAMQSPELL